MRKLFLFFFLMLFSISSIFTQSNICNGTRLNDLAFSKLQGGGGGSFSFVVLGDSQLKQVHYEILNAIPGLSPDFVINIGDVLPEIGNIGESCPTSYDEYHNVMSAWMNQHDIPFFTVPGNHEFDSHDECHDVDPLGSASGNHDAIDRYIQCIGDLDWNFNYSNNLFFGTNNVQHTAGWVGGGASSESLDFLITPERTNEVDQAIQNAGQVDNIFSFTHVPLSWGNNSCGYEGYIRYYSMLLKHRSTANFHGHIHEHHRERTNHGIYDIGVGGGGDNLDTNNPQSSVPSVYVETHSFGLVTVLSDGTTEFELYIRSSNGTYVRASNNNGSGYELYNFNITSCLQSDCGDVETRPIYDNQIKPSIEFTRDGNTCYTCVENLSNTYSDISVTNNGQLLSNPVAINEYNHCFQIPCGNCENEVQVDYFSCQFNPLSGTQNNSVSKTDCSNGSYCNETTVTPCLNNYFDFSNCTPVEDPNIVSSFCEDGLGISRYLSRAASAENLTDLLRKSACNGFFDPTPPLDAEVNCDPPYNKCSSSYCPDAYCEQIKAMVDMNIQFITRAAKAWYRESSFKPGSSTWDAQNQLICDVNAAYDCSGLKRPLIQAGIFEGASSQINGLTIENSVLHQIMDKLNIGYDDLAKSHFDANDNIILPFEFMKDNMYRASANNTQRYDLTKIETQIWFMYQAMSYIDMGYTALHMGVFNNYADQDEDYEILRNILGLIRSYAEDQGSIMVLNAEGGNAMVNDTFLFDFSAVAASFTEINTSFSNSSGEELCDDNTDNTPWEEGTPCFDDPYSNSLAAVLSECVIRTKLGEETSGFSPDGCWVDEMPFYVYIDFGHGVIVDEDCEILYDDWVGPNHPSPGVSNVGPNGGLGNTTYGYDDSRWFGHEISAECRNYIFNYYLCEIRNMFPNGSMLIPAMLNIKFSENYCAEPGDGTPSGDGSFLISDEPDFVNSIQSNLEPVLPQISITTSCNYLPGCKTTCDQATAPTGYRWKEGINILHVEVTNPDCSSEYSIHVQHKDGSWLDYSSGSRGSFAIEKDGLHRIIIRQDNLGFSASDDPNQNGTVSTVFETDPSNGLSLYFKKTCCNLLPTSLCIKYPILRLNCISSEHTKEYYDFTLEVSGNNISNISLKSLSNKCKIISSRSTSQNELSGRMEYYGVRSEVIDFQVDYREYYSGSYTKQTENFSNFMNCETEIYAISSEFVDFRATEDNVKMNVYPNPTLGSSELFVEFPFIDNTSYKAVFYNTTGARVLTKDVTISSRNGVVNLNNELNEGLYFLRLSTGSGKAVHTFKIYIN